MWLFPDSAWWMFPDLFSMCFAHYFLCGHVRVYIFIYSQAFFYPSLRAFNLCCV